MRCPTPSTADVGCGVADPAELRVVTLAAEGQTNAVIAESLFINLKTVESHLTRVYKKLGISDRGDLKNALAPGDDGSPDLPNAV